MAQHPGQGVLPDMDAEGEAFEHFPQPTFMVPTSAPSKPLMSHLESGSVLDVSAARFNSEHLAHEGTAYGHAYHDSNDYRYRWEVTASTCGYDGRIPGYPLSLALSPSSHSPNDRLGMADRPLPTGRFRGYGTIYTDDSRMKLGDGIRRQCFNCRATETKTWRRSKLSLGKMVCNKCGLFERAHDVPRPKSFPPRRRSQPASVHQSWNSSPDVGGHRHYNEIPSITPFTCRPLYAFGPREGGEATSQDATSCQWMAHNMTDVSSVPSYFSPGHTETSMPTAYHPDFQLPSL